MKFTLAVVPRIYFRTLAATAPKYKHCYIHLLPRISPWRTHIVKEFKHTKLEIIVHKHRNCTKKPNTHHSPLPQEEDTQVSRLSRPTDDSNRKGDGDISHQERTIYWRYVGHLLAIREQFEMSEYINFLGHYKSIKLIQSILSITGAMEHKGTGSPLWSWFLVLQPLVIHCSCNSEKNQKNSVININACEIIVLMLKKMALNIPSSQ